ncbi:hypothetical protein E2I00_008852, partial [Balaenoptera physalus]
ADQLQQRFLWNRHLLPDVVPGAAPLGTRAPPAGQKPAFPGSGRPSHCSQARPVRKGLVLGRALGGRGAPPGRARQGREPGPRAGAGPPAGPGRAAAGPPPAPL